jgi:hypothetical protein
LIKLHVTNSSCDNMLFISVAKWFTLNWKKVIRKSTSTDLAWTLHTVHTILRIGGFTSCPYNTNLNMM